MKKPSPLFGSVMGCSVMGCSVMGCSVMGCSIKLLTDCADKILLHLNEIAVINKNAPFHDDG